jgi:hypothetical protein
VSQKLTQALELLNGHPAIVIYPGATFAAQLPLVDEIITSAQAQQRAVYFITTGGTLQWRPTSWQLVPWDVVTLDIPTLQEVWGRIPVASDIARQQMPLDVYKVMPAHAGVATRLPFSLPIGGGSYPYLWQGFYGSETAPSGAPFRWTDGDSLVAIPWPGANSQAPLDACLHLAFLAGRPSNESPGHLVITVEGETVYDATVANGDTIYRVEIPLKSIRNQGAQQLEIRLTVNTWNAATYTNPPDPRHLGIALYSLDVESAESCTAAP